MVSRCISYSWFIYWPSNEATGCGGYNFVMMDKNFIELESVRLDGQLSTENPLTTLSCSPAENLALVSIDNALFQIDLTTMAWESIVFYFYSVRSSTNLVLIILTSTGNRMGSIQCG